MLFVKRGHKPIVDTNEAELQCENLVVPSASGEELQDTKKQNLATRLHHLI